MRIRQPVGVRSSLRQVVCPYIFPITHPRLHQQQGLEQCQHVWVWHRPLFLEHPYTQGLHRKHSSFTRPHIQTCHIVYLRLAPSQEVLIKFGILTHPHLHRRQTREARRQAVQSASPSLPRTPANLGFPTLVLHQHQASQGLSSGPEGFYLPTSTPGVYIEYARGPMPGQPTPTHPHPSMQMILSQTTPTRTAGYATQPTPTAHSDETGASSPPQSETVLRYRRMAAKYRAAAETLRLSGDYWGSTKAISNAIDLDRKAHRLQSKHANQIKNRAEKEEKRRQAAMQAGQAMPIAPDVTTSYSPQNERAFKVSSAADDLRGAAALLQMSGDSVGARNAMAEAEPEERQASSLQASNSSSRAMDLRRDSGCPENKAIEHVDVEASKPATDNPEQRTPSSQK